MQTNYSISRFIQEEAQTNAVGREQTNGIETASTEKRGHVEGKMVIFEPVKEGKVKSDITP